MSQMPSLSDVSAYGSPKGDFLREGFWLIVTTKEWKIRQPTKRHGENIVKDIKRATRRQYSSEEEIRIVLDGLRCEDSIAGLCRPAAWQSKRSFDERGEGISLGTYDKWSKDFMEVGKRRLAGDRARVAKTDEVKDLRREARDLKEVVAEQRLELRLLKKA